MASALEVSLDNFLFDLYLEQKLLVTGTHFDERSYNMYMHVWLLFIYFFGLEFFLLKN